MRIGHIEELNNKIQMNTLWKSNLNWTISKNKLLKLRKMFLEIIERITVCLSQLSNTRLQTVDERADYFVDAAFAF